MNQKVEKYFDQQTLSNRELLIELRSLIMDTIDDCDEDFKWGVPVYDNGRIYTTALKGRVNIGFVVNGLSEKQISTLEGTGKTMRHIKIATLDDIKKYHVKEIIQLVHKNA